jgi:hypothetical protein
VPGILNAMQSLASASPQAAASIVAFLSEVPTAQVRPSIVPRLSTTSWGQRVLAALAGRSGISTPVQRAIATAGKGSA